MMYNIFYHTFYNFSFIYIIIYFNIWNKFSKKNKNYFIHLNKFQQNLTKFRIQFFHMKIKMMEIKVIKH